MNYILSVYRCLLAALCIGLLLAACGQAPPRTGALSPTIIPLATTTSTPVPSPTVEPTTAPTVTPTPPPQAEVTRAVNLRQGPSTAYPIIRTLPVKTIVDVLALREEQGERWYRVRVEADEGWVSAAVLQVDAVIVASLPADTQALASSPTATAKPTAVPKPTARPTVPPAAAPSSGTRTGAICRDGTRSYATGRGACSHHGGVDHWLYQ